MTGWRPFLLIVLLGVAIYGQTLAFDFVHCDDTRIIIDQHERIGGFAKIPEAFARGFGTLYRPVLAVTWILDAAAGGTSPRPYHLTNVLVHLAASCLVFLVMAVLGFARRAALAGALVFCAHPLLVQGVAWIPGRNDALLALFVLLAFFALARLAETGRWYWAAVNAAAFVLALFTKEPAALFPVIGLFYLVFIAGNGREGDPTDQGEKKGERKDKNIIEMRKDARGQPGAWRRALISPRSLWLLAAWGAAGLVWFVMRRAAVAGMATEDTVGLSALPKNAPALLALAGKAVLPWKLSVLATYETASIVAGVLFFVALTLVIARSRGADSRLYLLGALWFFLFLVPTFFFRVATADDHYDYLEHRAYLPLVGLLIILLEVARSRGIDFRSRRAGAVVCLLVGALALRAAVYAREYRDPFTFWNAAIANDPTRSNFRSVLGKLHYERGELAEAERCFLRAVDLSVRHDPLNYKNLAVIYKEMGRTEEAIDMYERAVELDPENPSHRYFLGRLLHDAGRIEEAEACFLKAVDLEPAYADANILLVGIYHARGDLKAAVAACERILAHDPRHFHALNILGSLYAGMGEPDRAAEMWRRILAIRPDHEPSREHLRRYHMERDETADVEDRAEE